MNETGPPDGFESTDGARERSPAGAVSAGDLSRAELMDVLQKDVHDEGTWPAGPATLVIDGDGPRGGIPFEPADLGEPPAGTFLVVALDADALGIRNYWTDRPISPVDLKALLDLDARGEPRTPLPSMDGPARSEDVAMRYQGQDVLLVASRQRVSGHEGLLPAYYQELADEMGRIVYSLPETVALYRPAGLATQRLVTAVDDPVDGCRHLDQAPPLGEIGLIAYRPRSFG